MRTNQHAEGVMLSPLNLTAVFKRLPSGTEVDLAGTTWLLSASQPLIQTTEDKPSLTLEDVGFSNLFMFLPTFLR